MNHSDIRHRLSEYIDDTLPPDEKAAMEAHLAACAECADALRELRKTVEQVKQLEEVEAPAWMTSKIMAKVREEAERKNIFQHLFNYFSVNRALRVAAVLFLAITAYYIYSATRTAEKYAEAPLPKIARQEVPPPAAEAPKQEAPAIAGRRETKVKQAPGYRSLDMKDEYERPAPPVPAGPAQEPAAAGNAESAAPQAMTAMPAAPPMTARQEAGAKAQSPGRKQAPADEAQNAGAEPSGIMGFPGKDTGGELTDEDREAEERLSVTEHFVGHDLRENMKVKGLQFVTRKVPDDLAGLEWLREMTAYRSVPCARRYIVDVELHGRSLQYLYCTDRSKIKRLGVFELISGVWIELK